ncbi:RagB/SusD family nutrient uptake outer membrane protein [Hymenobacter sp. 15J16-1T3B]|uniref:RagB/SusD family nutrient uptake outer membrane protein n=1 Tax=Hymenobacter sp. 15J16-1T3B TaxID=2886941 RepID=UPI001D11FB98|nr:RagB/SusD family nutrient uptake outer membrane protein [Hymenobacter sp. 15J16-1T3B]MCC3160421.1 RagB/SusD family nutrient uptake outer membrane protein [Hymenobacter sp. 15J16-1T3B]
MKRTFYPALAAGLALFGTLTSCDDALDKTNLGSIDEKLIYNDSTLAKLNVDYIYDQNLPTWFGQSTAGNGTMGATNPSILSEEAAGNSKFFQTDGSLTANDVGDFGTALNASNNYGKIRTINMYLVAVRNGSIAPKSKNRLLAQAYFFRAWRYFDLVRLYGGVPLVLKPQNAVGAEAREAAFLPRNTTTETFRQIVSDLDSAAMFLPGKWATSADWGRITRGAALAMKARTLLYAASPQFNPSDDQSKWQAAYDASIAAKNALTTAGFGLHASYDQLWFSEVNNPEAVMVTGFNNSTGDQTKKNNGYDNATRPSYTGTGGGSNQPTWDLVQAYPMLDGKKITETGRYTYNRQLFYKNRDPRFAKTIAYNGASWPLNGNSSYKIWTYYNTAGTTSVETRASSTGFYLRKAINTSVAAGDAQYVGTDWIEIRYAEVLLNLAEAAAGVNRLSEAMDQLKAIRQRAGIENADGNYGLQTGMNRAQMFDAILYERQIELAYEGKRFWDLRRWKKFETVINNKKRQGVTIKLNATAPSNFATTRDNLDLDQVYTNYFTIDTKNLDSNFLNWSSNYYFMPIPQAAITNNPLIVQNNGGWGGSFDPLQ